MQGDGSGDRNRQRRVGVVERPEGKKHWIVLDSQGQAHTLHPRQITYTVVEPTFTLSELPLFLAEVESYLDPASLEVAWELLVEEGEAVDPAAMAQLLFSDQTASQCYAAYRLLSDDKLYFKQKGDRFEPRSELQVADLKHQQEREAERLQTQQAFFARLNTLLSGDAVSWQGSDMPYLTALERYVLLGDESNTKSQAIEILSALGRSISVDDTFDLLVALGWWHPHENLPLRRSKLPTQFSDAILSVVEERLADLPPDLDADRRDLTHLKVYTIDDESTAEIDDGLSLETLAEGRQRLWIHIADPTRWMTPGDPLDLEAQGRGTTVYLPTGMIPMFPRELSTGPMSLNQGQQRCALSFGIDLDETGEVEGFEIAPSTIKPTYRLSYEDVDEMLGLDLQDEPELMQLAQWAGVRSQWRQSHGAISINMPESLIKVDGDSVSIQVLNPSRARALVAEMMILAGEVAARYGATHKLPLPFRHQPQPELPPEEELLQLLPGLVRDCAIRRCMPKSEVSTTPNRHASLGLDGYCQVTSPIRRYADLVAHFQIKAHLRGDPLPFGEADLNTLLASITTIAHEATLVERQTNRYWSLEFLRRQGDQVWTALVLRWLRDNDNLALILLEDLGLELVMRLPLSLRLGDRIGVKVAAVNPRLDTIHLTEHSLSPATATLEP
nr:ribonuclease R family protein [Petrachloros mirabilis]